MIFSSPIMISGIEWKDGGVYLLINRGGKFYINSKDTSQVISTYCISSLPTKPLVNKSVPKKKKKKKKSPIEINIIQSPTCKHCTSPPPNVKRVRVLSDAQCSQYKKELLNKLGNKCTHCGCDKPHVLQLHHEIPKDKRFSFALAEMKFHSIEELNAEAKKCILLCTNCHGSIHKGVLNR